MTIQLPVSQVEAVGVKYTDKQREHWHQQVLTYQCSALLMPMQM